MMIPDLTIVLASFGLYDEVIDQLKDTINQWLPYKNQIQLVMVFDGGHWQNNYVTRWLDNNEWPSIELVYNESPCHIPSQLFNKGIKKAQGRYISFNWIGASLYSHDVDYLLSYLEKADDPVLYFKEEIINVDQYPDHAYRYSWSQISSLYCLNHLIIKREIMNEVGYFDTSFILQKDFGWYLSLKLAKSYDFKDIKSAKPWKYQDLSLYPFEKNFNVPEDIVHRYIVRATSNLGEKEFIKDLNKKDYNKISFYTQYPYIPQGEKIKLTIVTGYWDFVHNQLGLFNYLDRLQGTGFGNYKIVFDHSLTSSNLEDSELVIFSRCRHANAIEGVKYCKKQGIKTLYMLDDNWLSIMKDWPDMCRDDFRNCQCNFIEAIELCDAVLVYNEYLEKDIKKYNENVYRLNPSIDMDLFNQIEQSKDKKGKLLCGYVGTERVTDVAFKALNQVAKERDDVRILIAGYSALTKYFKGLDVIHVDYQNYFKYVETIKSYGPDLLLAPLDDSHTSISKCPIKYMEISALGAVGIYSNVYPYSVAVKDKVNGLLIKKDTIQEWKDNICLALNDTKLSRQIKKYSYDDVKNNYSVNSHLKDFLLLMKKMKEN